MSGFTPKDIKQLKKDAFKDALPVFGKTELNKAQVSRAARATFLVWWDLSRYA